MSVIRTYNGLSWSSASYKITVYAQLKIIPHLERLYSALSSSCLNKIKTQLIRTFPSKLYRVIRPYILVSVFNGVYIYQTHFSNKKRFHLCIPFFDKIDDKLCFYLSIPFLLTIHLAWCYTTIKLKKQQQYKNNKTI